jgi:hypothetical protein
LHQRDWLACCNRVECDPNKEALEQVKKATGQRRSHGEELLESKELKRKLREANKNLAKLVPPVQRDKQ